MFIRKILLTTVLTFSLLGTAQASDQPVYDRVMKSQTIRCGYAEWPPFMVIDPNTKEVSGMFKDVWETMGKKLGLKIEWETVVGWGEVTTAINTRKIDAFCLVVWPDAGRIKNMLLSRPVVYSPVYLYARADDKRFDNNYDLLNDPKYKVVGQDGDITAAILETRFPKATKTHIAPTGQSGDRYMMVSSGKGDVTLQDAESMKDYMKQNPGKLRRVIGPSVVMMQDVIPLAVGETQMKNMIDTALTDMINDGTISSMLKKINVTEIYAPVPDVVIGK